MAFAEYFERVNRECIQSPPNPILSEVLRCGTDLFIFSPNSKSNPVVSEYFAQLDMNVQSLLEAQLPNGSWPDFEADLKLEVEFLARYWVRPFLFAVSYTNTLSRHYRSPKLLAGIETALRRGRIFTKPGYPRWGNWWACDIGFPLHVTPTLLLIGSHISKDLKDGLIQDLYFKGFAPQHIGFNGEEGTGANAAWVAINTLRLAALSNKCK